MKKVLSIMTLFIMTIGFFGCDLFGFGEPSEPSPDPGRVTETQTDPYFGEIRAIEAGEASALVEPGWYETATFYHIWINAFRDSDNDGIGDIPGIIDAMEEGYFTELGINAIWLSPFFHGDAPFPQGNMHLYDTIDHYSVQEEFGTTNDVITLLNLAHSQGIKMIFDYVPNHIADEHPWFQGSARQDGVHDDWFIWSDDQPTTGWPNVFGSSAWHYNEVREAYYYGVFVGGMPDLNYRNPEVRKAMMDVMIYWLNLGFDGIRGDAIKYIYEDTIAEADLTDNSYYNDHPDNLGFFQAIRDILDQYDDLGYGKMMIAENWTTDLDSLNYYGGTLADPAFHMTLDFQGAYWVPELVENSSTPNYPGFEEFLASPFTDYDSSGVVLGSFLSNHDTVISRPASLYSNEEDHKNALVYNMLSGRVPFLYYANEIGAEGISNNDINLRQDMNWSQVSTQESSEDSLLSWYRAVGTARSMFRDLMDLRANAVPVTSGQDEVIAWVQNTSTQAVLVLMNQENSTEEVTLDLSGLSLSGGQWSTLVGTDDFSVEGSILTANAVEVNSSLVFVYDDEAHSTLLGSTVVPPEPYIITLNAIPATTSDVSARIEYPIYSGDDIVGWEEPILLSLTDEDGDGVFSGTHNFGTDNPGLIRWFYSFGGTDFGVYNSQELVIGNENLDDWDNYFYTLYDGFSTMEVYPYYESIGMQFFENMYLRGTIVGSDENPQDGWAAQAGVAMSPVDSFTWEVEIDVLASETAYEFKFATTNDAAWTGPNYPFSGLGNFSQTITTSGRYLVSFNHYAWEFLGEVGFTIELVE